MNFYIRNNRYIHLLKRIYIEIRIFFRFLTLRKFYNFILNVIEKGIERLTVKSLPPHLYIETTNLCNLRCPNCANIGRPKNKRGTMSDEIFLAIVDTFKEKLISTRIYFRGDPLMDMSLLKRLAILKKERVNPILVTNFSMKLAEDYIKQLIEYQLSHIVICFEHINNEKYQKYRIGGNIEIVKKNVAALVKEKRKYGGCFPFISFRVFISKHNEDDLNEIYGYFLESGVDNILFVPMIIDMGDREAIETWLPDNSKYRYTWDKDIFRRSCWELWSNPVITYDGKVMACCLANDYKDSFGLLGESSFKEIWNSTKYVDARNYFKTRKIPKDADINNICLKCRGRMKLFIDINKDKI